MFDTQPQITKHTTDKIKCLKTRIKENRNGPTRWFKYSGYI